MRKINYNYILAIGAFIFSVMGCRNNSVDYYSVADFEKMQKIDAHFHYNTSDPGYIEYAARLNFKLISVNVDAGVPVNEQLEITSELKKLFPDDFAFIGTFSVDSFGTDGFTQQTINRIDQCMKAGAAGIKVWKNIGMVLKDKNGSYVMVDDPAFKPVFDYIQTKKIPLLAHLGEPKNCWLPINEMTMGNDKRYFEAHPQYHMYLQPQAPSYQDQIDARDNLLKQHPGLDFTGAHLASLEWSVDELSQRFESFPDMKADLTDRIGHLQYQSLTDRDKIRNFLIKYQDRLLYGS
ncbi:MAG: hypothetical protein QG576_817, partial [Bacteroidota bacterium]|nr:hypothetical protein [Bacteroidota bacterium]